MICDINVPSKTAGEVYFYMPADTYGSEPFRADVFTANCSYSNSDGGFRLGLNFRRISQQAVSTLTQFLDRR